MKRGALERITAPSSSLPLMCVTFFSALAGLVSVVFYCHTVCMGTEKGLARLCICAGSTEPSLLPDIISTTLSYNVSLIF